MSNFFARLFSRDLRAAAAAATQAIASETMAELANAGPYWDGLFASAWEARLGEVGIPADQEGLDEPSEEAQSRQRFTPADFPAPLPEPRVRLQPITIGNRMVYRLEAMDLAPGVRSNPRARITAPRGWFETFNQGGPLVRVMDRAVRRTFQARGFRRTS